MPVADAHAALEALLAPAGWAHASALPVDAADPGRFHALFGRDSLLVSLQVLPQHPEVAAATLRALAQRQGAVEDPETEEQPGRILHEDRPEAPARLVRLGWPVRDGALRYFGSADATAWWLVVLDALATASPPGSPHAGVVEELAAARAAAAGWLERALAAGGGLVRSGPRRHPGGLAQQGWRDAADPAGDEHGGGIVHEDGTMPAPPLADADTQAVTVAALDALARLEPDRRDHWRELARRLRDRVGQHLTPEVMALDGTDRPVSGAGSQLGWLLWAEALSPDAARTAAERLLRPDLLTSSGVRTLAATHPAYLPEGYHRGAVWPFDSWLCWGGLRAAGHDEAAERVRQGVLRAVARIGDFPELYAVTAADEPAPVAVANRVQAWTVGAVLALEAGSDGRPPR